MHDGDVVSVCTFGLWHCKTEFDDMSIGVHKKSVEEERKKEGKIERDEKNEGRKKKYGMKKIKKQEITDNKKAKNK
jgi:hypothetical protein